MPATVSICIQDHFEELTDPRQREGTYPLINMVVIAVCAVKRCGPTGASRTGCIGNST